MFHSTHWTEKKVAARLKQIEPLRHRSKILLQPFRYKELPDPQTPPPLDEPTENWHILEADRFWGPPHQDFLMRGSFQVPKQWKTPALYLPLGLSGDFSHPETLVYLDGQAHAGCDRHHQEVYLPSRVCDGEKHELALHGWTGLGSSWSHLDPTHRMQMRACYVVDICPHTRGVLAAARVALGLTRVLDQNDPARTRLLNVLYEAFQTLDTREPMTERFYESAPQALQILTLGLKEAGHPLEVDLVCAGHAHLDVGWLWPVGQTRGKAARTFHTVDHLMDAFPDYHFSQSQPQLYDFIRKDYPQLFERIKERVKEGRWEVLGGLWVEADANLTGAESLVRQLLLGRGFFREHFGEAESPVLWLPDVFGYTWSLPQLIKQAGLEYFFTIKIGWNQYNRMPVESFWWQGIDGTRVLTHFSTTPVLRGTHAATYNAEVTPEQYVGTWRNFQQQESQDILLMAYGYGDGGGGPTREMLENLDFLKSAPSAPRAKLGRVGDFFKEMERRSGSKLPTWKGELYLEYHRGTYTTQAALKRGNRKCEVALHNLEFLASWACHLRCDYRFPAEKVKELWQVICLNQFHDILPGSSIRQVNVEAARDHSTVLASAAELQREVLERLTQSLSGELLLFNPTSFERHEPIRIPGLAHGSWKDSEGLPVARQGEWLLPATPIDCYGVLALQTSEETLADFESELSAGPTHLENRFLRVEFDHQGQISRCFDKQAQRELLPPGQSGNQLQLFEDRPMQWDAWDIDIYYTDRQWTAELQGPPEVVESGPLVAALKFVYTTEQSTITQFVSLACTGPRLDFTTEVEWRERHTLLKAAFPVDILSPEAKFEIQWGHVSRPTHRNTSWDWARFEVPAQKWADLSEGNYGVSLLNDCKYGYDVSDGQLRITLLRSPTMPDPEADQGRHGFTYALLPHQGTLGVSTIAQGYFLNYPVLVHQGRGEAGRPRSLVRAEPDNLVIETVKPAQNEQGITVRHYEALRHRGEGKLVFDNRVKQAQKTDLLEENAIEVKISGREVQL
ncbi:MAG TPA: alpha-mannosidase, partial [Phycisphaerales bacterium]|nr:alpha-mannosidase [Phycisphaerales bacterium]